MYKVWCVMVGIALFLPLWALAQQGAAAKTLAAMRDKSRPVLIFYPDGLQGDSSVREQRALFDGHEAELKERDVALMFLPLIDRRSGVPGHGPELQKQFHVDDGRFTVVLIGKDGDEKFRFHEPVTIEKLDALIDAMPMRQQEVRDGHHPE